VEVVASLSQGRTPAAQCGLFTYKSVPVIFEPPCITRECGVKWVKAWHMPPERQCFIYWRCQLLRWRPIAQVVSPRPLTAKGWVHSQARQCEICGGLSGTTFSPKTSILPYPHQSTNALYSFVQL